MKYEEKEIAKKIIEALWGYNCSDENEGCREDCIFRMEVKDSNWRCLANTLSDRLAEREEYNATI